MKIPKVNEFDFYFETAYNASRKVVVPKHLPREMKKGYIEKESAKVFFNSLYGQLDSVITHFPKIEDLSPFYIELVEVVTGVDIYKKKLGSINWAKFMVKKLYYSFVRKKLSLKDFYGRSKSVLKQVSKDLVFLENVRKKFLKFPSVKSIPTVLLAGFPNVGKTSLLSSLTSSNPEINSYPFTTKEINVGVFEYDNFKVQVIDTPGLLERPLEKRNVIELKAITALKHLANIVLFLFDTSDNSGYTILEQENLLKSIYSIFPKKKVFTVTSKCELDKSKKTDFYVSCKEKIGINDLKKELVNKLKNV